MNKLTDAFNELIKDVNPNKEKPLMIMSEKTKNEMEIKTGGKFKKVEDNLYQAK